MSKVAVVTGASTGIGRAVALKLSKHEYEVILVARRKEKLDETAKIIHDNGGTHHIVVGDLSNTDSINKIISTIKTKTQHIDVIANIAGIWHGESEVYAGKDFQTFDQKVILDTYYVGIIAPTLLVHGLLPFMKSGGKIINLSGTFENGAKGWLPYYVSKRAIEDLTIGLAQELEEKGIQVNCVSPSDTATDAYSQFFLQYIDEAIDPKKIAEMFLELSQPENKTTGKVIVVKKGMNPFESFHA